MNHTKGRMFRRMMAVMLSAAMISGSTLGAVQAAELDAAVEAVTEPVVEAAEMEAVDEEDVVVTAEPEADAEEDVIVTAEPEADVQEDEEMLLDVSEETDAPEPLLEDAGMQALEAEATQGNGWTLDAEGKLTITSADGLTDWKTNGLPTNKDNVQSLEVNATGKIPVDAFRGCGSLTEVTISEGITEIDDCAFRECTNLTNITLPDSLTGELRGTFYGCTSLAEIEIPAGVQYLIGNNETGGVFQNCTNLGTVTLKGIDVKFTGMHGSGEDTFKNTKTGLKVVVPLGYADVYCALTTKPAELYNALVAGSAVTGENWDTSQTLGKASLTLLGNVEGKTPTLKRYSYYNGVYRDYSTVNKTRLNVKTTEDVTGGKKWSTDAKLNTAAYYKWMLGDVQVGEGYFQIPSDTKTAEMTYCNVTFKNGDTVCATSYVEQGKTATKPANPTTPPEGAGKNFAGWTTTRDEGAAVVNVAAMTIEGETTFYAKWSDHNFDWESTSEKHWQACQGCDITGCDATQLEGPHIYVAKHDANEHWQECSTCGYKTTPEKHTFGTEWQTGNGKHWQVCTAEGCGQESTHEDHTSTSYETSDTQHWQVCDVCKEEIARADHQKGDWQKDGTNHWKNCTVCKKELDKAAHTESGWVTEDADNHWKTCTECQEELNKGAHTWEWNTEAEEGKHSQKCSECGKTTEAEDHEYTEIKSDKENHWGVCECGATETPAAHTVADEWKMNDTNHWQTCTGCDEKLNEAAHSFGEWKVTKEATADAAGLKEKVCACGYKVEETIPQLHTHSYGDWKFDEKNHWKECSCGDKKETAAHSFGEWTTTKEATVLATGEKTRSCKVCGAKETAAIAKLTPFIQLNVKNGETVPMKVKQKSSFLKVTGMGEGDSIDGWKSSNKKIVTVDAKGKLTAKKKGTATVTVTLASGVSASVKIKVQKGTVKTKSVSVTVKDVKTKKLNLKKKEKVTLSVLVKPLTTQQKVTYKSSNKKVATVSKKGVVTAKKKGKAKITVKSGSKKFVITVYVK